MVLFSKKKCQVGGVSKSLFSKRANIFCGFILAMGVQSSASFGYESDDYLSIEEEPSVVQGSDYHINTESHDLLEIIEQDLEFIKKHPTVVMNAAQIVYTMIKDQGVENMQLPGYGNVPVYKFFSRNNDVTDGKRIIGQYEGIKAVVDGIEAQAKGSKSGVKVPLLVGTHGTGKTEFRTVVSKGLKNLTRHNEKFFVYEVSWLVESLKSIPNVGNYLKTIQEEEFRSPLHSTPISILPAPYLKAIKKKAQKVIAENLGNFPVFDPKPDPISKYIRDHILEYFMTATENDTYAQNVMEELGVALGDNGRFSSLDEVKILNHFCKVRRVILGEPGTVPLIDAQGEDIDYQGLIMSENPIFRMLSGPTNVWSWNYNGAVLSGNRNFTFLDEFFRNDHALRDMFLGIMESRVISRGGSPSVPVDTVIVAATNSANLDKALADPRSAAQVNRMRPIPFEWAVNPQEIAKILFYMNGKGIKMQELTEENSEDEFVDMDLDLLFPDREYGKPIKTPDGRYKLIYGTEDEFVYVAPHTIMFMSDFIAATRINTSSKDALALKGGEQIIGSPLFREPLTRLKAMKGEVTLLSSQEQELYKLSKKLREGSFGLSARVAGTWLSESLIEAKQDSYDQTLTPIVLRKVYNRLLNEGSLEIPDVATELKWKALMDLVAQGSLIPKYEHDILSSLLSDGKTDEVYQELIMEMVTLHTDASAKEYELHGQTKYIDFKRQEQISKIFQKITGKPLANQQIAMFYLQQMATNSGSPKKHKYLVDAITQYLSNSLNALVSVKDLLEYAETQNGSKETATKYRNVESTLYHKLGYNKRSVIDALKILKQYRETLEH